MGKDLYETVIAFECGWAIEIITKLSERMKIKLIWIK